MWGGLDNSVVFMRKVQLCGKWTWPACFFPHEVHFMRTDWESNSSFQGAMDGKCWNSPVLWWLISSWQGSMSSFRKLGSGFHDLLRENTSSLFTEHSPISIASLMRWLLHLGFLGYRYYSAGYGKPHLCCVLSRLTSLADTVGCNSHVH